MRSILSKIICYLGGIVLLALVCNTLITTSLVSKTVTNNENTIMQDDNLKSVANIELYFTRYVNIVQQMARDQSVVDLLSGTLDKESYQTSPYYSSVYSMLQATGGSDKANIVTVYVAKYTQGASPDFGFDGGTWTSNGTYDLNQKDYWFAERADIDKGFIICDPYKDIITGEMVTAISAPVYNKAKTQIIGIVAVDIKVSTICDMVTTAATDYKTGYHVLISNGGYILAHKNQDNILKKYDEIGLDASLLSAIKETKQGVLSFQDTGKQAFAVVGEEEKSGWTIINVVPAAEYQETTNNTIRTSVIINALTVVIILSIMLVIGKSISNPLKRLTETTDKLAAGDLEVSIEVHTKDEVGCLAQSMGVLVGRLKSYIAYINEISNLLAQMGKGNLDLTFSQTYDGDFRRIKEALLQASDMLSDTLFECNTAANQVASGSEQVAAGAQVLSQGATEQASSIEELSASLNEISAHIQKAANDARKAREISIEANAATERGQKQMENMVSAMNEISKTSTEIGKIIKNIDDIAFQTNILALNAAVEAARAGSAGKGFAVVADEVRNLAGKSAESAKTTATLIDNALQAIGNGTKIVVEAAKSLEEVVANSKKSVEAIEGIATIADRQAQSIVQVNLGVEQISAVVQTNSATAEESAAASEELSSQAQMFNDLIGRFKLKNQSTTMSLPPAEEYENKPYHSSAAKANKISTKGRY